MKKNNHCTSAFLLVNIKLVLGLNEPALQSKCDSMFEENHPDL